MKHFLITRFNIRSENWKRTKSGLQTLSDDWLKDRFNLFESYCLPSVKQQSNQEFIWCVIFDEETPVKYINKIEALSAEYPKIHPLFVDGFNKLQTVLSNFSESKLNGNESRLITTRLDNDDIIHKDFIETIQSLSIHLNNTIIDLRSGLQLIDHSGQKDIRLIKLKFNPFITLVESIQGFETIVSRNHNYWRTFDRVVSYSEKPMWIQVVHKNNLVNMELSFLKKVSDFNPDDFSLQPIKLLNDFQVVLFNLKTWPQRLYYSKRQWLKEFLNS